MALGGGGLEQCTALIAGLVRLPEEALIGEFCTTPRSDALGRSPTLVTLSVFCNRLMSLKLQDPVRIGY